MNKTKHKRGFDLLHKGTKIYEKQECFSNYFHCKTNLFLCLQHVENKGFQTVIKHRLKAIQKPIKNELGNREKTQKMHISFWENAHFVFAIIIEREKHIRCI